MEPVFLVYSVKPADEPRTRSMTPHCRAECPSSDLLDAAGDDDVDVDSAMMIAVLAVSLEKVCLLSSVQLSLLLIKGENCSGVFYD